MSVPDHSARTIAPVFDGQAVAVVLATDANYAPYAAVTIRSVISHASPDKYYDLVLLETELAADDLAKLKSLAEGRDNISLRFFDISEVIADLADDLFVNAHLSPATYYRLFTPSIFPRYDKLLYLDVDLVAMSDVAELYETELGDHLIGSVRDYYGIKDLLEKPEAPWTVQVGLRDNLYYFNAGVALLNLDRMRRENFEETWQKYLTRVKRPRLHDQDILNNCCQGRIHWLDPAWNCQAWNEEIFRPLEPDDLPAELCAEFERSKRSPKIIHYLSKTKPWDRPHLALAEHFWDFAFQTPYYPAMSFRLVRRLSAECDLLRHEKRFPSPALKLKFYRLAGALTFGRTRERFRQQAKKYKARLRLYKKYGSWL